MIGLFHLGLTIALLTLVILTALQAKRLRAQARATAEPAKKHQTTCTTELVTKMQPALWQDEMRPPPAYDEATNEDKA